MNKIKVKLAFVFVLCGLLGTTVFAEDGGKGDGSNAGTEQDKVSEETVKKTAAEQKAGENKKAVAEKKAQEDANNANRKEQQSESNEGDSETTTESPSEPENTVSSKPQLPLSLFLTAAAIALILLALTALNFIATSKMRKKIPAVIQEKFNNLVKKQDETKAAILNEFKNFSEQHKTARYNPPPQDTAQIERLQSEIMRLKKENQTYLNRIEEQKTTGHTNPSSPSTFNPISIFNNWAQFPSATPLPHGFVFLAENIKIREEQKLSESNIETAWITNRGGAKKYLFPNPRFLDDRSNITAFYTNGNGFANPKGQNKIKIIEPCEIFDYGVIRYPGKLEIL